MSDLATKSNIPSLDAKVRQQTGKSRHYIKFKVKNAEVLQTDPARL